MAMIIIAIDGEYAFLVDGVLRPLDKPKKKKAKHIQLTKNIVNLVPSCGRTLQDADIRKHLAGFDSMVKGGRPHCQRMT